MVEPRPMAQEPRLDLAQAECPGQLTIKQRQKLPLARQPPHPGVGTMFLHKRFEPLPRHELQNVPQYCIVMRHGADLLSCPGTLADVQNRLESTPCALSRNSKPDSRGSSPAMTGERSIRPHLRLDHVGGLL